MKKLSLILIAIYLVLPIKVAAFTLATSTEQNGIYTAKIIAQESPKSITVSVNLVGKNVEFIDFKDVEGAISIKTCENDTERICSDIGLFNKTALHAGDLLGTATFRIKDKTKDAQIVAEKSQYEDGTVISGTLFNYSAPAIISTPVAQQPLNPIGIVLGVMCVVILLLLAFLVWRRTSAIKIS